MCGRGQSSRGRRTCFAGASIPIFAVFYMTLAISGLPAAVIFSESEARVAAVAYGIVCQDGGSLMKQKRIARIAFDGIY